jgi:hypothetical protein
MAHGGIRPDIDPPAMSSPVVNKTSGDERRVRARPAAFPVNGINESGTSPRAPKRPDRLFRFRLGSRQSRQKGRRSRRLVPIGATRIAGGRRAWTGKAPARKRKLMTTKVGINGFGRRLADLAALVGGQL